MTNFPSAFEASFTTAFVTYNQIQPMNLEFDSEQHERLALQAGQLVTAYDIMVDQGLHPQIAINRAEPAPLKRQPRGTGPCHDPLVTGPNHYDQPYVTLFGDKTNFTGHLHITNALRAAIAVKTNLKLNSEATPRNFIASTAEIQAIVSRRPLPKERLAFVGRDDRTVRSGAFGLRQKTYRASLDYYPAKQADPSSAEPVSRRARVESGYAQVYTRHNVIPAFGMLHLVDPFTE